MHDILGVVEAKVVDAKAKVEVVIVVETATGRLKIAKSGERPNHPGRSRRTIAIRNPGFFLGLLSKRTQGIPS